MAAADARNERSASIDYLRAFVTLMVLGHHSSLAYTTFAHFDEANFLASTAPIVDKARWAFLDYAENFNDVFFMSLMFAISGLFVWPQLRKWGAGHFLRDRLVRLGLPFLVGTVFVMPLAYYPSYLMTGRGQGYLRFWFEFLTKDGWAPGPLWFVWLLLFFDCLAALVFLAIGRLKTSLSIRSPLRSFAAIFVITFFAYVPLLARFGFGTWVPFLVPPFYFQLPRLGLYLVWFVAGILLGRGGIEGGMLARDGRLGRRWPLWVAATLIVYNLLWFVPGDLLGALGAAKEVRDLSYVILWVLSCAASCYGFLAFFTGAIKRRRPWMDFLARMAYVMYIVHYVFVTWAQYFLLQVSLPAGAKFVLVYGVVLALSALCAKLLLRVPRLAAFL